MGISTNITPSKWYPFSKQSQIYQVQTKTGGDYLRLRYTNLIWHLNFNGFQVKIE